MEQRENVDLSVTGTDVNTTQHGSPGETAIDSNTAQALPTTDLFFLKFSKTCRPFKLPEYPEIAYLAGLHFNDPAVNVTFDFHKGEKFYIMETTEHHSVEQKMKFTVRNRDYFIKLDASAPANIRRKKRENRSGGSNDDGLLLTFYQAGRKFLNGVPNSTFDHELQKTLGLELYLPTQKQRIKDTPLFNGNRFAVVKRPENLAKIPDSMPVTDPVTNKVFHIRISYFGQLFYCARCMKKHGRKCPELTEFYEAKDKRDAMARNNQITTKIMSDSTLRHADALGMTADVLCMSGGGVGQVVQAAFDDPDVGTKDIIVVAGANDVKNNKYETEKEYAESLNQTMAKVSVLAENDPDRDILIVTCDPIPPISTTDEASEEQGHDADPQVEYKRVIRREYMHRFINDYVVLAKQRSRPIENLYSMKVKYETDDTGHPTINGTKQILHQINNLDKIDQKLIWNPNFVTNERMYRGVQSVFRYGCSCCYKWGEDITNENCHNPQVCDACTESIRNNSRTLGYPLLDEVLEYMQMDQEEEGGSGKSKRELEEDHESVAKKQKGKNDGCNSESDDSTGTVTMDEV